MAKSAVAAWKTLLSSSQSGWMASSFVEDQASGEKASMRVRMSMAAWEVSGEGSCVRRSLMRISSVKSSGG